MNQYLTRACPQQDSSFKSVLVVLLTMVLCNLSTVFAGLQVTNFQNLNNTMGVYDLQKNILVTITYEGNVGDPDIEHFEVEAYKSSSPNCEGPMELIASYSPFENGLPVKGEVTVACNLAPENGDQQIYVIIKIFNIRINGVTLPNPVCGVSNGIRIQYPDLVVSSLVGPYPHLVQQGTTFQVDLTIDNPDYLNNLATTAPPSVAELFLATSENGQGTSMGFSISVPELAVGGSFSKTGLVINSADYLLDLDTTYYLYVAADSTEQVFESDETNNFSPVASFKIVDFCHSTDFNGDGHMNIYDLILLVDHLDEVVTADNAQFNLVRTPPYEVINIGDFNAALPCWGTFKEEAGGILNDFWVSNQGSQYQINLDVTGQIAGTDFYVKTPAGVTLMNSQVFDILGSEHTVDFVQNSNSAFLLNEFENTGTGASLDGAFVLGQFETDIPLDFSLLQDLQPGDEFGLGVIVNVYFADGSHQTLRKKLPYMDIPDPQLRAYFQDLVGVGQGQPIPLSYQITNLWTLSIPNRNISDLSGIEMLTNLRTLDCSQNQVTKLPDLRGMKRLVTVKASQNNIIEWPLLPSKVKTLELNDNQLKWVPEFDQAALVTLNLNGNRIVSLPDMSNLGNLQNLDCGHNQLSRIPALPSSIQTLDASYNYIYKIVPMPCCQLTFLDVSHNQVNDLGPFIYSTGTPSDANDLGSCAPFFGMTYVDVSFNNLTCDDQFSIRLIDQYTQTMEYIYQNQGPLTCFQGGATD